MRIISHAWAKYPFLAQARNHVKKIELDYSEETPENKVLYEKAEKKISRALNDLDGYTKAPIDKKVDHEIFSFPFARILVAATGDSYIKRRYALAEAKRATEFLSKEKNEKILEISKTLGWKIRSVERDEPTTAEYPFALHFTDYLKNAASSGLTHPKWKLVNRPLIKGEIYIKPRDACRLLEEEIRRYIEHKLEEKVDTRKLSPNLLDRVNRLKALGATKKAEIEAEMALPENPEISALPPCIRELEDKLSSGHHLSHSERFALVSFLLKIGMTEESLVHKFSNVSDFNRDKTAYQIRQIAKTNYTPPRCSTLLTHGICQNRDSLCTQVSHPLQYYRQKCANSELNVHKPSQPKNVE